MNASNRGPAWTTLDHLFQFGLFVLASVFAVSLAVALDRFQAAFGPDWRSNAPDAQLSIVLFVFTFVLVMQWYLAVGGEMHMLRTHGEEFLPPLPNLRIYPMILGALLALLLFFSNQPIVYGLLLLLLKLVERFATVRDINPKIAQGLADARLRAATDDPRRRAWRVFELYYFGHRHLLLWSLVTSLCATSLGIAAVDRLRPLGWVASIIYVLLIVALAMNEIVYSLWRRERDVALGDSF